MRAYLPGMIASVLVSATAAQAQQSPAGQGADQTYSASGELNNQQNFRDFYAGVGNSSRLSTRPVAVLPEDIVQGLDVRDAKGLVVGKVKTVGNGFAVVASDIGQVEVDFASFAKNRKGLLINLPKSKIDVMMARNHPAG
jgi:nitrogen fixation protein FixH